MSNDANWYTTTFKAWQAKQVGSKPTADQLASIHNLGARPGKQAMACAMALRPEGVTAAQIVQVCGAPQLNKMRGFITDGLLKRVPQAPNALGHSVYKLELTAKGTKRVELNVKRLADEAAKGEAEGEAEAPKKAKAKPATKAKGTRKAKAKGDQPVAEQAPSEPAAAPEGTVTGEVMGNAAALNEMAT